MHSRDAVLDDGVDVEVANHLASLEQRKESTASGERDGSSGRVGALGAVGGTKSTTQRSINVVVDDGTSSTSSTSIGSLQPEFARATRDECDGARNLSREVGLKLTLANPYSKSAVGFNAHRLTAQVRHSDEWSLDLAVGRIGHQRSILVLPIDGESSVAARERLDERLVLDVVVVAQLADKLVQIQGSEVVARAAKHTVAAGGLVGNGLQVLGVVEQRLGGDVVLEGILLTG